MNTRYTYVNWIKYKYNQYLQNNKNEYNYVKST